MADLTGKDVGRYHVVERLGHGGMAEVYKAFDTRLQRDVALKVIRKDAIAANLHESMMKRFEREALALARLAHPNIVQVYDFGSYKGEPYLVMEYLTGGTLSLKSTGKPIPWQEAARLLAPVARALECAHEENILHRDVKPANILLTRQGIPKLSDFGIARILDIEGSTQLTGTNMGIGTPEYMAPEQWVGKPVPQTDVYALGIVFYELVTGKRPYTADTPLAVMQKQLTDPLPRPREYIPDMPEVIEQVLFKALAKNPTDRYGSMGEFASILERMAVEHGGTTTTPTDTPTAIDQTQLAAPWVKKINPNPPSVPEVIPTQQEPNHHQELDESNQETSVEEEVILPLATPTYPLAPQPEQTPLPLESSQQVESQKIEKKTGWHMPSGTLFLIFVVFLITIIVIGNNLFNQYYQQAPTIAGGVAVEQTAAQPTTSTPQAGDTQVSEIDGMVMVWVPAGEFEMGSNDGSDNEKPAHVVYLGGYWMDRTEVTNRMFRLFVDSAGYQTDAEKTGMAYVYTGSGNSEQVTGADWQHPHGPSSSISGLEDHPVVQISWNDASAYCGWAGRNLPSEAQWEKAGRGTDGRIYPWGDAVPNGSLLNFADRSLDTSWADQSTDDGYKFTAPVGSYPSGASPYGILDMAGNVMEWVMDWYGETYYNSSPASNPEGPSSGSARVLRGGSWYSYNGFVRSADRSGDDPGNQYDSSGFRCSLSP